MQIEHLFLVLPSQDDQRSQEMAQGDWSRIIDQFGAQHGRELILGGSEPLLYPGFWVMARRGWKAKLPKVSAFFTGSLLEPWVMRELVQSSLQILIGMNGLGPESHDARYGPGAHARAMGGLERLLRSGLASRTGIVATASPDRYREIPQLAAWAVGRGLSRFLWSGPDLGEEEKAWLVTEMRTLSRTVAGDAYIGPFDLDEDPLLPDRAQRSIRVEPNGEAYWGIMPGGGRLGNLRFFDMGALLSGLQRATG